MQIRPYRASDYRAVLNAQCDLYEINFPRFVCTPGFLADQGQRIKAAARRPYENGIFVLDDEGVVAGFVWVVIRMDLQGAFGSIDQVYLLPEYRRKGLGRELMRAAERFLRERGVEYARLYVTENNRDAVALYRATGYAVTRYEMEKRLVPDAGD